MADRTKTTALVVDTGYIAQKLNQSLPEHMRAYAVGHSNIGTRYDQIIVLATMTQDKFPEWFDNFVCCLAPGGELLYD